MIIWLCIGKPITLNLNPWKFVGHKPCGSRDTTFLICHLVSRDHPQHLAKFVGNKSCWSGDTTFLICRVTLCDHVTFGGWEPLTLNHSCVRSVAYRSCGSGDIAFLFCHVTSCDQMIKETCDPVSENPKSQSYQVWWL